MKGNFKNHHGEFFFLALFRKTSPQNDEDDDFHDKKSNVSV